MHKAAAILLTIVFIAVCGSLTLIALKEPEITRRMCLQQPNKMWSKGVCYDR